MNMSQYIFSIEYKKYFAINIISFINFDFNIKLNFLSSDFRQNKTYTFLSEYKKKTYLN